MNDIWGVWFYKRPTNTPNLKKVLREWLGVSNCIENDTHKRHQWQQFFSRLSTWKYLGVSDSIAAFSERGSASPDLSRIKLSTPTLSLNSKGDLVTCPCAFRCRRLAENLPRESGLSSVGGLLPLYCRIALKWRLRDFFPFRNKVSHKTCT